MTNSFLSISNDFLETVTGGRRADDGGGGQPPNGEGSGPGGSGEARGRSPGETDPPERRTVCPGIGGGLGGQIR